MVLLDSTAPATAAKPRGDIAPPRRFLQHHGPCLHHGPCRRTVSVSARLGLGLYGQLDYRSLPPRSRDEVRASMATASHVRNTIGEFIQATASWTKLHLWVTSPTSLWSS